MPNVTRTISANFGTGKSGKPVGYSLFGAARATSGVSEAAAGSGVYLASVTYPAGSYGLILWDTGDSPIAYASETVNPVALDPYGLDQVVVEPAAGAAPALNARQTLSLLVCAAPAGIVSGAGSSPVTVMNPGGTANRVVAKVDSFGNRTDTTLTPPA